MSIPAPSISEFVTDLCAEECGGGGGSGDLSGSGTAGRLALWGGEKLLQNAAGYETASKLFYGSGRISTFECVTIAGVAGGVPGATFTLPAADAEAGFVLATDGAGHLYFTGIEVFEEVTMGGDVTGQSSLATVVALWNVPLCSVEMPDPLSVGTGSALVFRAHGHGGEDLFLDWGPQLITSFGIAGDVSGNLGACTVTKLQGVGISASSPAELDVLRYSGGMWGPSTLPSMTGPWTVGGDLSGVTDNATVVGLMGDRIRMDGRSIGYVLMYNYVYPVGQAWIAVNPGTTFLVGGDVTGLLGSQTVVKIQGRSIDVSAPDDGDLLAWSAGSSYWTPVAQADIVNQLQGEVYGASNMTVVGGLMGLTLEWSPLMATAPKQLLGVYDPGGGDRWRPFDCLTDFLVVGEVQGSLAELTVKKLFDKDLDRTVTPITGHVLTYTNVGGVSAWRPTLPAGGGGGGVTFETPTGACDDQNVTFTMATALGTKDRVEVDGIFDNAAAGVGTTLTTSSPPHSYVKIWRIT